jgi:RNA polymerase sigma factor (sigma-70 family)
VGTKDQIARTAAELSECGAILRIAGGDVDALREFYGRQAARVHGFACRLLGDAHEAEEATQDVFVRVWRRAGDYDARRASPWGWLAMMTRSACIDRLRRRRVRREVNGETCPEIEAIRVLAGESGIGGAGRLRGDETADLAGLFDLLRPAERECLIRVFFEGLSQSETAERTGLPLGTVKTHLRRGLERLRKTLSPHDS